MNNFINNEPLDEIGKSTVLGKQPYYTTNEYKEKLKVRIAGTMQEEGENLSKEGIEKIINTYTAPATEDEWKEIIKSIEEKVILPFDPKDLDMFKEDILVMGIRKGIEQIGEKDFPYFLTLGSAEKIKKKKEGGRETTLGPIELDLQKYKNQITPFLDQIEITKINSNPYRILMKIDYSGQDNSETIPLENNNQMRQGRRKYNISFVVLEDTNKTPGYTLVDQGFHVNKKEMNKDEFKEWFKENQNNIMIPKSLNNNLE